MKPLFQAHPAQSTQAEEITIRGYFEGAATSLTLIEGVGITWAWVSTGKYRATIPRYYAALVSWTFDFGADTPGDVKAFSTALDVDSLTKASGVTTVDVSVYNGSATLADLAANQFLSFALTFRDTGLRTNG